VTTKEELASVVGVQHVFSDEETLNSYAEDYSFTPSREPQFVVQPKSAAEVQEIVQWANRSGKPLVPVSSTPPRFRGDTVPSMGHSVIADLSRMKKILRIDRRNRMAVIEPGVTYYELQPELVKAGMRLPMPLLPRVSKSVVASLLEREPTLIPKYQWQLLDPLRCTEIVWGNGDILRTGEAGSHGSLEEQWKRHLAQVSPMGPAQTDFYRFVSGAQGTMGIVTWASLRCEVLPQLQKLFFVQSDRLDNLLDFVYRLLKFRYGDELLFLNSSNLACIFGDGVDQMRALKKQLSQWVFILCIAGYDMLPEERIEFQEKDVTDIAQQFGMQLVSAIPGLHNGQVLNTLSKPSREPYWKLRYKGNCQDIFFLTTLNRTPEFLHTMYSIAEAVGYTTSDIGVYIQPVMQGVACHCEFSLPYDPDDQKESTVVQELLSKSSQALLDQGAFFSRPYGIWSDMAYNKDAQSTVVLKKIKSIFDPNSIMNPGKLCF